MSHPPSVANHRDGQPLVALGDASVVRAANPDPSPREPLGTSTKSYSASGRARKGQNPATARALRYVLQHVAADLLPNERVAKCLRWRQSRDASVSVWRSVEHRKAHFKGLQVCGSLWSCPVCAAKISERRRAELVAAITTHTSAGGGVMLLTLTNSHDRKDDLAELLEGQAAALKRFRGDRASMRLFDAMGVVGMIRSVEVTHGDANGWHPHYHFLVFTARPLGRTSTAKYRTLLAGHWIECCRASGLKLPSMSRGVDLRGGEHAAKYASKWGLEDEMVKSHIKTGREGRRTPWDLLKDAARGGEGCEYAGRLFREYAQVFKGKRQLVWSKGLKAALGVEEISDEEIAVAAEDDAEHVLTLSHDDWLRVCRHMLRWKVLDLAEEGGAPAVLGLLHDLALTDVAEYSGCPF